MNFLYSDCLPEGSDKEQYAYRWLKSAFLDGAHDYFREHGIAMSDDKLNCWFKLWVADHHMPKRKVTIRDIMRDGGYPDHTERLMELAKAIADGRLQINGKVAIAPG